MKAMIFAAGIGSRLKPFTDQHPKALVEVDGVPMLERVILHLKEAGVKYAVVNVHHFASQIVDFLVAHDNFGIEITVSDETNALLDTGGGLLHARPLLTFGDPDEPILLHNADILTDADLGLMLRDHIDAGRDATLLCSHRTSSRTLWFDTSTSGLRGWENLTTGELRPAGFTPDPAGGAMDSSPFGGVHIISPKRLMPMLEKYGREVGPIFSIIPFYLSALGSLSIGRYLLPSGRQWFDVGSPSKLLAASEALSK